MDRGRDEASEAAQDGEAGGLGDGRGVADPRSANSLPGRHDCPGPGTLLPTLREPPADAEAAGHKLLARGGFIRQLGAGLWTFLPLGWRVHQKVVQIIREEINAIGGQEMLGPS